jgi:protein gp37
MGRETGISWTDSTWNPIRGCSRVSEGCRHCYAESVAHRFSGPGLAYEGLVQLDAAGKSTGKWNGQIKFVEEHLLDPLRWKKPQMIFVNSMSDLFHENVTDEMRDKIFAVMALCPQHTFQVLTKRPERMLAYFSDLETSNRVGHAMDMIYDAPALIRTKIDHPGWSFTRGGQEWEPLSNVHLGVSVDDQPTANLRIPLLLRTPAAVRFISAEPLLGSLNIRPDLGTECVHGDSYSEDDTNATICRRCEETPTLDWVIVGGESVVGARPMHPDWARSLRDQCNAARVPFFFKQWGELAPGAQGANYASAKRMYTRIDIQGNPSNDPTSWAASDALFYRVGTKAAGCLLDGVEHHEFPLVSR